MSASSQTIMVFHNLVREFYSRKLLLQPPAYQPTTNPPPFTASPGEAKDNAFNTNVLMVLAVLLCALVCSLGLNSLVRCALRCSNLVASQSAYSARLANTGMKSKAIKTIPTLNYSDGMNLHHLDTECVICLSEFAQGELVRVLPNCNHGFHVLCIDKWLSSHSSCPTCRYSLIETSQKKKNCGGQSISSPPPPPPTLSSTTSSLHQQDTVVSITPLHPEPMRVHQIIIASAKCSARMQKHGDRI
ncbi:hypothetical protein QQ045_009924 [Rhodiola kirilowii]